MVRHWNLQQSTLNFGLFVYFCHSLNYCMHEQLLQWICMATLVCSRLLLHCRLWENTMVTLPGRLPCGSGLRAVKSLWTFLRMDWWQRTAGEYHHSLSPLWVRHFIGVDYCTVSSPLPYYSRPLQTWTPKMMEWKQRTVVSSEITNGCSIQTSCYTLNS